MKHHSIDADADVVVVGAGPSGAALAVELGRRGFSVVLLEAGDGVVRDARLHTVSIRTMEIARRWGIESELRNCGWPLDRPQDVVWGTSLAEPEIARLEWPAIAEMRPPEFSPTFAQRCPQRWFNAILLDLARRQPSVEVRTSARMESFVQDESGVSVELAEAGDRSTRLRCRYLVGCDGGRSTVRGVLGIEREMSSTWGTSAEAIIRSPDLASFPLAGRTGRFTVVEPTGMSISLLPFDGREEFRVTLMVHDGRGTPDDIRRAVTTMAGPDVDFEFVTEVMPWTNREAVAHQFFVGRVILAGDAAHTMPTTGGMGMNTGILDSTDLGWKLQALMEGWGGPGLLPSYEHERRSAAVRTAALASAIYRDWLAMKDQLSDVAELEQEGPAAEQARQRLRELLLTGFRREFNAVGGALGYRYEDSPICVPDGTPPTPDVMETYVPTARPGHLAPHVWLEDGTSTIDLFDREFVLLCLGGDESAATQITATATVRGIPWRTVVLTDPAVRKAYARNYALVRPDGHVAWRGDAIPTDVDSLLDVVTGHGGADALARPSHNAAAHA
ncbi:MULTISPECIES: FAD-dependent monooxygenase [unclassified Streptomyces]|uniref:FAD-dependent monooxygenase n=1 Tax=Streptomyces sp. 900129855 TaxID=3155129 RepID=A0ABV2ZV22_9ACTN|nr:MULTISPECIES: FAD-dependent monooxygenase [unclassified Streptomyces]KQV93490.1 hypothetical protein ASD08_15715 [Streptomyces sp. Root369]